MTTEPMTTEQDTPPEIIRVYHRQVGTSHVFTSHDLLGLHVGHPDLRAAYDMIAPATSMLVSAEWEREVEYQPEASFEELETKLNSDDQYELYDGQYRVYTGKLMDPVLTVRKLSHTAHAA